MYGQIYSELDANEVEMGEVITGCGQLTPGIAHAQIQLTFVKSDGSVDGIQITAQNDGTFSFNYTPDVVGEWTVSIRCTGATYIMQSVVLPFNVVKEISVPEEVQPEHEQPTNEQDSGMPIEYIIVAGVTLIVAAVAVVAYLFIKKRNTSSPVVISD
jgi:hypothetical protein